MNITRERQDASTETSAKSVEPLVEDAIPDVFRRLGLGTEEEREHFRRMADLGTVGQNLEIETRRCETTNTQNNTTGNEDAEKEL